MLVGRASIEDVGSNPILCCMKYLSYISYLFCLISIFLTTLAAILKIVENYGEGKKSFEVAIGPAILVLNFTLIAGLLYWYSL
jgi:hypothetical protein